MFHKFCLKLKDIGTIYIKDFNHFNSLKPYSILAIKKNIKDSVIPNIFAGVLVIVSCYHFGYTFANYYAATEEVLLYLFPSKFKISL